MVLDGGLAIGGGGSGGSGVEQTQGQLSIAGGGHDGALTTSGERGSGELGGQVRYSGAATNSKQARFTAHPDWGGFFLFKFTYSSSRQSYLRGAREVEGDGGGTQECVGCGALSIRAEREKMRR